MRSAIALLCMIAASALAQLEGTPPPLPPPGRLVDIGGWKVHLNCTGDARPSQPTVILEAGLGDFSVEWSLVQPAIAKFARVCSYDRAGDGWSELGPHPRTFRQIVYELHTLLEKAEVRPPFVMVGHSYGGWLVRQYQWTYPREIVGMVLVEAGADNPWRLTANGKAVRASDLSTGQAIPEVKKSGPLRVSDLGENLRRRMLAGSDEMSKHANDPPRDKLPPDAQRMRTWVLAQLGHVAAGVNPFEIEELTALHNERLKTERPLGDLPLIVLTRGMPEETGPNAKSVEEDHRHDHQVLAAMSTRGKLVVAERSGHHIQLDQPDFVTSSIREVLSAGTK